MILHARNLSPQSLRMILERYLPTRKLFFVLEPEGEHLKVLEEVSKKLGVGFRVYGRIARIGEPLPTRKETVVVAGEMGDSKLLAEISGFLEDLGFHVLLLTDIELFSLENLKKSIEMMKTEMPLLVFCVDPCLAKIYARNGLRTFVYSSPADTEPILMLVGTSET